MKRTFQLAGLLTGALLLSTGVNAETLDNASNAGSLHITVKDDMGDLVHSARVYIYSENKQQFFGSPVAQGRADFELPTGTYRVYAAMVLKEDGYIDHYSSPEATVQVGLEEPASVILSLQLAPESEMILSDTARAKMGIDEELAKHLN